MLRLALMKSQGEGTSELLVAFVQQVRCIQAQQSLTPPGNRVGTLKGAI